jgi:hypothetical protein
MISKTTRAIDFASNHNIKGCCGEWSRSAGLSHTGMIYPHHRNDGGGGALSTLSSYFYEETERKFPNPYQMQRRDALLQFRFLTGFCPSTSGFFPPTPLNNYKTNIDYYENIMKNQNYSYSPKYLIP